MADYPLEKCLTLEPHSLALEMAHRLAKRQALLELEFILTKEAGNE